MTGLWFIFLALFGIGFYIAAYTGEGEKLAESLGGIQTFLCSGAGGLVFALLLSYPANGCADLQCENILGSATISQESALGVATVFGLLTGLVGFFYRFVAIGRKVEREKAAQQEHNRQPPTEIEEFGCSTCGKRIRLDLPLLHDARAEAQREGLTTYAASCPGCGGKLSRLTSN